MAASQSSVLPMVIVEEGRASAGHRSRVVVPETVLRAMVRPVSSVRERAVRWASGSSAGRPADPGLGGELLGDQAGGTDLAAQQGGVHVAAGEAGRAVVDAEEFERGFRVLLVPAAQQGGGVRTGGRPGVAQAQGPGGVVCVAECPVEGGHRDRGLVAEGEAVGGEREVVRGAVDEVDAHFLFQLAQGAGDGRLGQMQALGGAGDAQGVGDGEKATEMTQLDAHACGA